MVLLQKPAIEPPELTLSADSLFSSLVPLTNSVSTFFNLPKETGEIVPPKSVDHYPDLNELIGLVDTAPKSFMKYNFMIRKAAATHGLDPDLIRSVILVESRFKPEARSHKGAGGLMQIMPETAKELGITNVYNPDQNINGGSKYLRKMLDMFNNNVRLALAAYNAGPGAVKQHNGIPPFAETRGYVRKVMTSYQHIKNLKTRKVGTMTARAKPTPFQSADGGSNSWVTF